MKRVLAPLALALLLAGCSGGIVIDVDPFPDAVDVTANTDPERSVDSDRLFDGESVVYEVSGPSSGVPDGSAMYIELDRDLEMRVYRESAPRTVYASSSSEAYFASGDIAIEAAAEAVAPSSISYLQPCRGSCVILRSAAPVYVRITNRTGGDVDYNLYAYVEELKDDGEPGDNVPSGATILDTSGPFDEMGAIETLVDVDHYEIAGNGSVILQPRASREIPLTVTLQKITGEDDVIMEEGTVYDVDHGDLIRVRAENNDYAAAPANSAYVLTSPSR